MRKRRQRMRLLDSLTESMDVNLSKLREMTDRGAWLATFHRVTRSQTRLTNWTTTTSSLVVFSEVPVQYQASLVAQSVKNPPAVGETGFDPWVRKIPWRRAWQPTPVLLPGESHGQRSLAGCSPWGGTKSDMTERLSTFLYQSYTDLYTPHLRTQGGSTEAFE